MSRGTGAVVPGEAEGVAGAGRRGEIWGLGVGEILVQPLWLMAGTAGEARGLALSALQAAGVLGEDAGEGEVGCWELGLPELGPARAYGCCVLGEGADLAGLVAARPGGVEPSARCLGAGGLAGEGQVLALWREGGELCYGFFVGEAPVQVALAVGVGGSLADELRLAAVSLEAREFAVRPERLLVWGDALGEQDAEGLGAALGLAVVRQMRPFAQEPGRACGLLPAALVEARGRDRRQRVVLGVLGVSALVLAAGMGAWAWVLRGVEGEIAGLEGELVVLGPRLAAVEAVKLDWEVLGAAVDPDAHPVEILHRLQRLFPEEGIRLVNFEYGQAQIFFEGEASSREHALRLMDELGEDEGLSGYRWKFPQPTILEDGRATFLATGE
jgi:hypothetical protein